jgi:predicted transcriptional regulator
MDIHQKYFEIIFSIIKKQNEFLLKRIALQENINGELLKEFIPSKKEYRKWMKEYKEARC